MQKELTHKICIKLKNQANRFGKILYDHLQQLCIIIYSNEYNLDEDPSMDTKYHSKFELNDSPIQNTTQDELQVKDRIVKKIETLIKQEGISPLTIAITGEWGSGKSSVINILSKELTKDKKNVVIHFEPLIEGKFEVIEILELFYLKLYIALQGKKYKVTKIFHKILSNTKVKLKLPIIETETDLKNLSEELGKSFSEQTDELNGLLHKNKIKIFLFIDEIDRLPNTHVINFLLFARILETFKNLICIVGIDYNNVLLNLESSAKYGITTYDQARGYLDKLFHARFHIRPYEESLLQFAKNRIELISQKIFDSIFNSNENKYESDLKSIINYLRTPRKIKKWLISLTINKPIIEHYPDELSNILKLAAICIEHPTVLENFEKHTLPMLNPWSNLALHIKETYGIDCSSELNDDIKRKNILRQSTGIRPDKSPELELPGIRSDKSPKLEFPGIRYIVDPKAIPIMNEVLRTKNLSWLYLFFDGYVGENKAEIYYEFFEGDIDKAIRWILNNPHDADLIALDLARTLREQQAIPKNIAKIDLLNQLWQTKTNLFDLANPYKTLILPIYLHPAETVVKEATLGMLELYLHKILEIFGIKNKEHGKYDLDDFITDKDKIKSRLNENQIIRSVKFNDKSIENFTQDNVKVLLKAWIDRVENEFDRNFNENIQTEIQVLSVFYRYVQWGRAIGTEDKRSKLANYILNYLKSHNIDEQNKQTLVTTILKDCTSLGYNKEYNTLLNLFNKDSRLISELENYAKNSDYYEKFRQFSRDS